MPEHGCVDPRVSVNEADVVPNLTSWKVRWKNPVPEHDYGEPQVSVNKGNVLPEL